MLAHTKSAIVGLLEGTAGNKHTNAAAEATTIVGDANCGGSGGGGRSSGKGQEAAHSKQQQTMQADRIARAPDGPGSAGEPVRAASHEDFVDEGEVLWTKVSLDDRLGLALCVTIGQGGEGTP